MKILVVASRKADAPGHELQKHAAEEARAALRLVADDFVREIYGRQDGNGAVMVCEAESADAVEKKLAASLPFAREGFLTFDIFPLVPYRGIVAAAGT